MVKLSSTGQAAHTVSDDTDIPNSAVPDGRNVDVVLAYNVRVVPAYDVRVVLAYDVSIVVVFPRDVGVVNNVSGLVLVTRSRPEMRSERMRIWMHSGQRMKDICQLTRVRMVVLLDEAHRPKP